MLLREEGLDLLVVGQSAAIDWARFEQEELASADAVYLDLTRHFPTFEALVATARRVPVVVAGGVEASAALSGANTHAAEQLSRYLTAGRPTDLANAARYLCYLAGKHSVPPAPAGLPVLYGIHAQGCEQPFLSVTAFLEWKRLTIPGAHSMPLALYCFERTSWLDGETTLLDEIVREADALGLLVLPVFCDWELAVRINSEAHPLRQILADCGDRLAAIWNGLFSHVVRDPMGQSVFAEYDVPVLQIVRIHHQSPEQWLASDEGLSPMAVSYGVIQPEMLGTIEPTVVAASRPEPVQGCLDCASRAVPIPERIQHLVRRTLAWHRLRRLPNESKRLAIVLHHAPCKGVEATIATAAGLDALESAVQLMRRLISEGYKIEDCPYDGAGLLHLLLSRKAIHEFRWTNVAEIVAKGGVLSHVSAACYARDFDALPPEIQTEVNQAWGPFPGKAMVHINTTGEPELLITGLRFGNVTVLLEPKRGCYGPKCDGEVCRILHEPSIAPTHHWLATYWFIQREADAVIHMGADGPLEYLPGKRVGLSQRCYGEISLGSLPNIYPYVMSSTAEGLIAKRRARAVLIDHLSPPILRNSGQATRWAEIDELCRQHAHAGSVSDHGRRLQLASELREWGVRLGMLTENATDETLERFLQTLPQRLRQLRARALVGRNHVLGRIPDAEAAQCYADEARGHDHRALRHEELLGALQRTSDEIENVVRALNAHFVPPGPSGHLSRGKLEVLPTGRNFFGTDLDAIPTSAAWEIGVQMGELLLRRFLEEEGQFPQTVGVTLWSSDVYQAEGELVSQILWLLGCRPSRANGSRVCGVELIPSEDLTLRRGDGATAIPRPRIDVVIQMSGVVRDTLPNIYAMLDEAAALAGMQQEPAETNYVRAHMQARFDALRAETTPMNEAAFWRLASARVFSSKPGSYGTGVSYAVDASAWQSDKDLAEAFVNWTGYAYGQSAEQPQSEVPSSVGLREYARLMGTVDVAYQRSSGQQYDALSGSCYASFQGGMAATRRAVAGRDVKLYWGDSCSGKVPELRDLGEELELSLAGGLLNDAWLLQRRSEGYQGAGAVGLAVNSLFAWSALTHRVTKAHFDAVHRAFIENVENRQWLSDTNQYALEEVTRRLLEAASRGLWEADENQLEALRETVLEIDGDMEERMGLVEGELQGGSVDIKTRESVETWKYDFTL